MFWVVFLCIFGILEFLAGKSITIYEWYMEAFPMVFKTVKHTWGARKIGKIKHAVQFY